MHATATLGLALLAGLLQPAGADEALDRYRAQRRELAHRPRRIIFNNDGCDVLYYPRNQPLTPAAFVALRNAFPEGHQVDSLAYCSISSGFSHFTHHTKAGTVLTRQMADYGILPDARNVTKELIDSGADCLQLMIADARRQRREVFWSMRMNDTHDVEHRPDKPYALYPPLKEQHSDWLVGEVAKRTAHGRWSSVDYARPEIRELAFRYLEEVAQGYDVDGLELDYYRHLCFFKASANGGRCGDGERALMTEFMRRVRAMTETVGQARGKPLLVSIRVPDSVDFCRDLGLDLEQWLREGLVDLLITTCYFRLNPWAYSVALAHRYQVPFYACLSDSRVTGETRFRRGSAAGYRGRAMVAWQAGVDGIHLFNVFNPAAPQFREVGDPAVMAGLDKLYFVIARDGRPDDWLADGQRYRTVPVLTPAHPLSLPPDRAAEVELMVGEDFAKAPTAPTCTLHLELPLVTAPEQVQVTVNGQPTSGGKLTKGWLDLPVPVAQLRRGGNQVTLRTSAAGAEQWHTLYDGQGLPGPGWGRDRGSAKTTAKAGADGLRIADRGEQPGEYLYYRFPWGADFAQPTAAEAVVKVVDGSSNLICSSATQSERLTLWPDRIELWSDSRLRYAMNTTDAFHTYRMALHGRDVKVYVDGQLRLDGTGRLKSGRFANELDFGSSSSTTTGESIWALVRARGVRQVCRDLVLEVSYPKGR